MEYIQIVLDVLNQIGEPDKSLGKILIELCDTIKTIDRDYTITDKDREVKKAALIVKAINEIRQIFDGLS